MSTAVVDHEVVVSIVDQVWESLLQTVALPWEGEHGTDGPVHAEITLRGDWNGLVRLTCHPDTAQRITGSMLGADPDEVFPESDVHDAVGEIVNVIGGSVKGALGGHSTLGLPVVTAAEPGTPGPAHPDRHDLASRCVVTLQGSPVIVEVFAHDSAG